MKPKHGQRFRHRQNGNIGIYLEREGKAYMRYFRGALSKEQIYDAAMWEPEREEERELLAGQRAVVAYHADQALCKALGQFGELKMWEALNPPAKASWGDPHSPPMGAAGSQAVPGLERRQKLFLFIHRALGAELPDGDD